LEVTPVRQLSISSHSGVTGIFVEVGTQPSILSNLFSVSILHAEF